MATLTNRVISFSGVLKNKWPQLPKRVQGEIHLGYKYLYSNDDRYRLLLGADLPQRPHMGEAIQVVVMAFVPNFHQSTELDALIKKTVKADLGDYTIIPTYGDKTQVQVCIPERLFT